MAREMKSQLSDALYQQLQTESLVLLHTIDADSGFPTSSAITWVYATNHHTVRIALDCRSKLVNNVKNNDNVTLSIFEGGTIHSIEGKASIVTDELEGVPFQLVCVDVSVTAVKDAAFAGFRITAPPEFEKIYDSRAAEKLDNQVFSALKKA